MTEEKKALCQRPKCREEVRENPYRGHEPTYCSKRCKNIDGVDKHRIRRKQAAIDYLGGCCSRCGYKKYMGALHFHHLRDKKFEITKAMTMTMERIKDELDKCLLLCANCHAEIHHEESEREKK